MKTTEKKSLKIFKGAGFLLGSGIALVGAIIVFIIAENFVAAVFAAVPIGVSMGIGLEQQFQGNLIKIDPAKTRNMVISLSLGLLVFLTLYIIAKMM